MIREVALTFLWLGATSFGGPAAHVALMEDVLVRRKGWLTREAFLDFLGAANLIPGPSTTELAMHAGRARAGWPGLVVAGVCFIVPAAAMVAALAAAYVRFGALPQAHGVLRGVAPVVIAVVVQAVWRLGRAVRWTSALVVVALAALLAAALGAHEIAVLLAAGLAALGARGTTPGRVAVFALPPVALPPVALAPVALAPVALAPLFGAFLKIGATLFGSGYVLLAYLRTDLVERLGWLTERQLLDAVAIGLVTPGPVFTTATFVGWLLAGPAGAAVATAAIFLPSFVLVALTAPLVPRLRRSPRAAAFLDGVNVASLALMGLVAWRLGRTAFVDPVTIGIGIAAAAALLSGRVGATWVVLGGAVVGVVAGGLGG